MNKKILLITRNFPPLMGGMEKLNFNIFRVLSSTYDVFVAGPEGSNKYHKLNVYTEFPVKPLWRYVVFSLFKSICLALKVKPNIVFCGSGAAILAGYFSAKLTGATLVCYLHGLDIIIDSKIYQWLFLPLIKKSDLILVNSNHTCELAVATGIDSLKIKIIPPGVDLPSTSNKVEVTQQFRLAYNLGNAPFILIAGRITARKGIAEFVANVMPALVAVYPDLKLLVVGAEAGDAMKSAAGVTDNIVRAISALNLEGNVKLIGSVDDSTLSAAFFSAKALVFPVLNIVNDVEGFGMVAIEAAAHGLPTIGFSVGGVPDAIGHEVSGWLVQSGDYKNMEQRINALLSAAFSSELKEREIINYAKEFEWCRFEEKLKNLLAVRF